MAELNLTVTVPDEKVNSVIDALAYQNGYEDEVWDEEAEEMVLNPVTKAQYIKGWILHVVQSSYKAYNDALAKAAALVGQDEDGSDFS